MGLFDKKYCDVCGEKIKFLGNRKVEDGNLCKDCASKLSPWFSERRRSTIQDIKDQLAYREENQEKVRQFNTTRTIGEYYTVFLDEDHGKFCVAQSRDLHTGNPDILDFTQVTGCDLDIDESKHEVTREDKDGHSVSYNPPRYDYSYDFYIVLRVNHPWFDEMRFRINRSSVDIDYGSNMPAQPAGGPAIQHKRLRNLHQLALAQAVSQQEKEHQTEVVLLEEGREGCGEILPDVRDISIICKELGIYEAELYGNNTNRIL